MQQAPIQLKGGMKVCIYSYCWDMLTKVGRIFASMNSSRLFGYYYSKIIKRAIITQSYEPFCFENDESVTKKINLISFQQKTVPVGDRNTNKINNHIFSHF